MRRKNFVRALYCLLSLSLLVACKEPSFDRQDRAAAPAPKAGKPAPSPTPEPQVPPSEKESEVVTPKAPEALPVPIAPTPSSIPTPTPVPIPTPVEIPIKVEALPEPDRYQIKLHIPKIKTNEVQIERSLNGAEEKVVFQKQLDQKSTAELVDDTVKSDTQYEYKIFDPTTKHLLFFGAAQIPKDLDIRAHINIPSYETADGMLIKTSGRIFLPEKLSLQPRNGAGILPINAVIIAKTIIAKKSEIVSSNFLSMSEKGHEGVPSGNISIFAEKIEGELSIKAQGYSGGFGLKGQVGPSGLPGGKGAQGKVFQGDGIPIISFCHYEGDPEYFMGTGMPGFHEWMLNHPSKGQSGNKGGVGLPGFPGMRGGRGGDIIIQANVDGAKLKVESRGGPGGPGGMGGDGGPGGTGGPGGFIDGNNGCQGGRRPCCRPAPAGEVGPTGDQGPRGPIGPIGPIGVIEVNGQKYFGGKFQK